MAKAFAMIEPAKKDKKNEFQKNNYATLQSVIDSCKEALVANELSVQQPLGNDEKGKYIETCVRHSSGEFISSKSYYEVIEQKGVNIHQAEGISITYKRRYAWQAMFGMSSEDSDGNPPLNGFKDTQKPFKSEPRQTIPDAPKTSDGGETWSGKLTEFKEFNSKDGAAKKWTAWAINLDNGKRAGTFNKELATKCHSFLNKDVTVFVKTGHKEGSFDIVSIQAAVQEFADLMSDRETDNMQF